MTDIVDDAYLEAAGRDVEICRKSFGPMPSREYRELGDTIENLLAEIRRLREQVRVAREALGWITSADRGTIAIHNIARATLAQLEETNDDPR